MLCLISIFGYGQITVTYSDIKAGKSALELTGHKAGGEIDYYVASDGITYKIGDKITYGTPYNGGTYYNNFLNVTMETLNAIGTGEPGNTKIANQMGGNASIKRIECVPTDPSNKKTCGCKIYLVMNRGGVAITNFESAIAQGEVMTSGYSPDEALQELKRWKDKLDLEIITQEEYDAKKAELMKFIK